MVTIIDSTPAQWTLRLRCTGKGNQDEYRACGALLEVTEPDVFNSNAGSYTRPFPAIRCPQCGAVTDLHTTDIDITKYGELRDLVRG